MENISRVLIIIGSSLIAILIIGISIFVYNALKSPVARTVDSMSSDERNFFNSKFQRYEGGRVSGLDTKALVNISMQNANLQISFNERYRIPELFVKFKDGTNQSLERSIINSISDPNEFKNKFQNMLNKINNNSFFSVETELNARNGIVNKVTIEELNL